MNPVYSRRGICNQNVTKRNPPSNNGKKMSPLPTIIMGSARLVAQWVCLHSQLSPRSHMLKQLVVFHRNHHTSDCQQLLASHNQSSRDSCVNDSHNGEAAWNGTCVQRFWLVDSTGSSSMLVAVVVAAYSARPRCIMNRRHAVSTTSVVSYFRGIGEATQ